MHRINRENFDNLYSDFKNSRGEFSAIRSTKETVLAESVFTLGYQVLEMLEQKQEIATISEYFFENTPLELQEGIAQSMQGFFESFGNSVSPIPEAKGWHKTHLVFAMSAGWLMGSLATWLAGVLIGAAAVPFFGPLGPIGLAVVGIIAGIVGGVIEYIVDRAINEQLGIINGFRYVLFTLSIWWFWGSSENDINVLDFLELIIGGMGGKLGQGALPNGFRPPSYAFA